MQPTLPSVAGSRETRNESELTERRGFIESFVKEIVVMSGDALLRYTVSTPDDSLIPGRATEKVALKRLGSVYRQKMVGSHGYQTFAKTHGPAPLLGAQNFLNLLFSGPLSGSRATA